MLSMALSPERTARLSATPCHSAPLCLPQGPSKHSMQMKRYPFPLIIATLSFLALSGCSFELSHVFSSTQNLLGTPAQNGQSYEDVYFSSRDGLSLHGWYVPGEAGTPLVVLFHGNSANISNLLDYLHFLNGLGLSSFIFDYRGFGTSEGHAQKEEDLYQDSRGALDYLSGRGWEPRQMIYFGHSMGAAAALQMALETPPAGLILEAPFTNLREIAWHFFPFTYAVFGWWSMGDEFDNLDKIGKITRPVLLFHGDRDRVVPTDMSLRLFARAREPKTLVIVPGAGHSNSFLIGGEPYRASWLSFLASIDGPSPLP